MEGHVWTIVSITCLLAPLSDGVVSDCSSTQVWDRFSYYLRPGNGIYESLPKGHCYY